MATSVPEHEIYGIKNEDPPKMIEIRSFDGSNNNLANPNWGMSGEPLRRYRTKPNYKDGIGQLRVAPNPRKISNSVCTPQFPLPEPHPVLSSFMWAWGQFLDHEIDLSLEFEKQDAGNRKKDPEEANIEVPADDPVLPNSIIPFRRSRIAEGTGVKGVPRQQVNVLSAYIDASNVFGSSLERAIALRSLDGTGRLKMTKGKFGDMLPFNTPHIVNAMGPLRTNESPGKFFMAGDVRANEHNVLTCLHTLFLREHNRICDELACDRSTQLAHEIMVLGRDEAIYQHARRYVTALEQVITFEEFLPALLGAKAIPAYRGYDNTLDASIATEFSTAAYRLGHDMLHSKLLIACPCGGNAQTIRLDQVFWKPEQIVRRGIDGFLAGLAQTRMEQINAQTIEDVRSNLFRVLNAPGHPGMLMDLAALNIQRGRDHGLPTYNQCRVDYGLKNIQNIKELANIVKDESRLNRLQQAYGSKVNDIDLWIGGLCEAPVKGAIVGPLFSAIIKEQFLRLRNGDRFWYENQEVSGFTTNEIKKLKATRLSDVIKRNTMIIKIQEDVFRVS
ncbi:peroxidase family protein [Gimesia maris]|uniref:Peroxidase n=1 Tax=Gimesia maris TaxID=122 RepID=A0ABX5YNL7_9PLAN|nr:peroxidase family protein [Gimesia maris]EDL62366.1 peroxidase [Gimesia maris DSM 8797]QEG17243.1 peroxidase [Gimesia maris]QGQ29659.1 peroxiredoxin [Gimesia maris]